MEQQTRFRHLKMQVQRKLSACLQKSERFFDRTFAVPTVSYEVRGVKAGVAYLQKNTINFNRTLLLENPTEFVNQVVPHELAHLIVYQLFGRVKPHGKEWQAVMEKVFQLPAEIYHRFDVQSVQGKTFAYRCGCRIHRLSVRRHNKIQRARTVYLCQVCKGRLFWADKICP